MNVGQQVIVLSGAWIQAVGTVVAAIGSTPTFYLPHIISKELRIVGNALQALGNAMEAAGKSTISLETTGNKIQALGNLTVIYGIVADIPYVKKQQFEIAGNWLQAFGALLAVIDELKEGRTELLSIIGNTLQSWGNSMQAVGGILELRGDRVTGQNLDVNGSWIQAAGAVIAALGQSQEEIRNGSVKNES
ncbi:DUF6944 family repetitive protein [Bacillus sp. Marseille-Q3570]|uniref:DUF6944 family repetitive protein n=1 Tax=Bacillus sp. Marseille-Q3570 TaxID=2963522 RepID=UPI0021B74072|nr:hypothetical protein [Bacillus sp. Marseille-Q3570]